MSDSVNLRKARHRDLDLAPRQAVAAAPLELVRCDDFSDSFTKLHTCSDDVDSLP